MPPRGMLFGSGVEIHVFKTADAQNVGARGVSTCPVGTGGPELQGRDGHSDRRRVPRFLRLRVPGVHVQLQLDVISDQQGAGPLFCRD